MAKRLIPHTDEWFAWLKSRSPKQAALTRSIVTAAGKSEVCSVCGDEDAPVYCSTSDPSATIRLCDDCRRIRAANGETYTVAGD